MTAGRRADPGGPPWAWRLAVWAVLFLLRTVRGWRVRAEPPATLPARGAPLVVVFNHTSNIDAFLVVETVWRRLGRWCRPLVKTELYDVPGLATLARGAGAIPVARGDDEGRSRAYGAAVARLQEGASVLVAPEGTITHDGSLLPLRHGAARLALEADVDVLVVTHFGAQRAFSPVARFPERDVVVTMRTDLVRPLPGEDAAALTGRMAAIMLDRSAELQATYPQVDPAAPWWPPYATPAKPTVTARENLERYRASMADAVSSARERMQRLADEHQVEQRVTQARDRLDELTTEARERLDEVTAELRQRLDELGLDARGRFDDLGVEAWERVEALSAEARQRFDELSAEARRRAAQLRARSEDDDEEPPPPGP